MTEPAGAELVFVVDVSSFTKDGFVGSTKYAGRQVNLEFDDGTRGICLKPDMATRLGVSRGSSVTIAVENDANLVATATVAAVGRALRISDPKIFYAVGREGGAVLRLRRA